MENDYPAHVTFQGELSMDGANAANLFAKYLLFFESLQSFESGSSRL